MQEALMYFRPGIERQVAARELQGETTTNKGSIIPHRVVNEWKGMRIVLEYPPRIIYLSVDPGGAKDGHMGVTAHVEYNNKELGIVQLVVILLFPSCFSSLCWLCILCFPLGNGFRFWNCYIVDKLKGFIGFRWNSPIVPSCA